jgi:DNA-binding beta-propeller fold protein YncE
MRVVAAVLTLVLAAGCSHRDRANPFDPENSETGGAPAGFVALAGDGRIDLRWTAASSSGLQGYRIYRRTANDTAYRPLTGLLPRVVSGYADVGVLNGLEHSYLLYYVFQDGERPPAANDRATPGPSRGYVVDGTRGTLTRVTPDGRHVVATFGGFSGPTGVAVDSVTGHVWVADAYGARVTIVDPGSGVTTQIPGVGTPTTLAVDPLARVTWVSDESGRLRAFDPTGDPLGSVIEPLSLPAGVAVDVFDRSVVVCERGASRLRRYDLGGSLLGTLTVNRPWRVAIDSVTRRCWVTSFESRTLYKVPPSFTAIEDTVTAFQGPMGVAVDVRLGRIWVADAVAGQLVALDRNGTVLFKVLGMTSVREIAVDRESGDVWAVMPERGEVARVTSAGLVKSRLAAFTEPLAVAVDPGR